MRAQGPDGTVFEFPDGTAETVVSRTIRQYYAGQQAPPDPFADRPYNEPEARAATFTRGVTWNTNDEIQGAGDAVVTGARELLAGRNPLPAAGRAFDRTSRRTRALTERYRQERPVGAIADEAAGGITSLGLPGLVRSLTGQAVARAAPEVGRGLGAFANQSARAGVTGGAAGYAYGFNDQGNLDQRIQAGNEGALPGAAFGLATPAAVNTLGAVARPAWRAVAGMTGRLRPAPNTLGSFPGNIRLEPPVPPEGPPISQASINTLDRLADRARMSPNDVSRAFEQARTNPQGQVVADVFGTPGQQTVRSMTQFPGQAAERATRVAEQRSQEAPARLIQALRRSLQVSESRDAALRRLGSDYERAAAENYRPLFANPSTPQQRQAYTQQIEPLLDDPIMRDALGRAERIFARERSLGMVTGNADDNLARYLHYVKMGLDDAIGAAKRDPTGIQRTEMRGVMELRSRYLQALDQVVPGYGAARARWAGLAEAEEALDEGANFLKLQSNEVLARMQEMTPFQREHARIGLADAITEAIGLSGRAVGTANVANTRMLNAPEMRSRIAAAFDTPEQAADFLDTVTSQNRLMRNAQTWGGGSSTAANAAYTADNAIGSMVAAGGDAARGNVGGVLSRAIGKVENAVTMGMIERHNNTVSETLLGRIDAPEAKAFADEVIRILREREAARAGNAAASRAAAPIAGQQSGRTRE